MRLFILILTFLIADRAFAATFTVTSKTDDGPGSLREAIQSAANNNVIETDNIIFNLAGSSKEDRTITIIKPLPNLSSNLIIDGSTQPGAALSINGAKVFLYIDLQQQTGDLLRTEQSSNIEIYGLEISCTIYSIHCFVFDGITHLVFGAPGKGNVLHGFNAGLICLMDHPNKDVVIQGNFFGVDETGSVLDNVPVYEGIVPFNTTDLTIGGDKEGEGNVICTGHTSIYTSYSQNIQTGFINIIGNKIGTDITGTKALNSAGAAGEVQIFGLDDGIRVPGGTIDIKLTLTNNIIGTTVWVDKLRDTFSIKGNHFGLGADNMTSISGEQLIWGPTIGIRVISCNAGIIGGESETDKNYIANFGIGISESHTGNTTILQNSFRCNTVSGIGLNEWAYDRVQPYINITSVSATSIAGNSLPGSRIELFYNDDCGFTCEGKTYITTVIADAAGDWNYTGTNCEYIVATATDSYGATSEFSKALISEPDVQVTNSSCGKANGSITGLHVLSGNNWHWEDTQGKVVSNDVDLKNVLAGTYILKASIGNNSCIAQSQSYTIADISLPAEANVTITNISCGHSSGSLSTPQSSDYNVYWLTPDAQTVSTSFTATDLQAGQYYLNFQFANDPNCFKVFGPYEIKSDIANTLDASRVSISNATCDKSDGGIKGLKYSASITADTYIEWKDENGQLWKPGTLDLLNVPSGKYQLKLKDPANCDTLVTPFYTVANKGYTTTDASGMQIGGSNKCGHPYGSITGIKATNGETFTWTNSEGTVVGNTLDIDNLPAGIYRILIGNQYGCSSTAIGAVVPVVPNPDLTTTRADTKSGFCGVSNGYIHPDGIQNAGQYSFRWTDVTAPDITIGHTLYLDNILSGNFNLYAADKNGCEEVVGQFELTSSPVPIIKEESKTIVDETCGDKSGLITGLTTSGGTTPFTEIWRDTNGNIVSTNGRAENLSAGTYHLELEDANGCKTSSSPFVVGNQQRNFAPPVYRDIIIPRGTAATLTVLNVQAGEYSLFDDAALSTPLQQNATGTFTTRKLTADKTFYVTLSSGSCSSNATEVYVKVADATKVFVPGAFTPNGDGLNDIVKPVVQGLLTLDDFSIYDRFGNRIFRTTDISKGWKGDKNGLRLDTGTYIWIIKGKDINNKPLVQKGTVVLIH